MTRSNGVFYKVVGLGLVLFLFAAHVSAAAAQPAEGENDSVVREVSQEAEHPGIILGVHLPPVDPTMGSGRLYYWEEVKAFNKLVGKTHPIIMYPGDLTQAFDPYLLDQLRDSITPSPVPYLSMDPYGVTLESIVNGSQDSKLRTNAAAVKRFGKPMLIRFGHEFNTTYMPWGGNPQLFIDAYRHIVDLFAAEGVTNVQWVWSPNYKSDRPDLPNTDYNLYYPGDEYVDWISPNGFNWGGTGVPGWVSFDYLFRDFLLDTACRYQKPLMIGLTASANGPGSKVDWIADSYAKVLTYPNVRAMVWFNDYAWNKPGEADFRVTITSQYGEQPGPLGDYTAAYRTAISDEIFLSTWPSYAEIKPSARVCFQTQAPGSFALEPGDSATIRIEAERAPSFNEPISLSIVNPPSGISYVGDTIDPNASSGQVAITAGARIDPGTYRLTVRAESEGLRQDTEVIIRVVSEMYHISLPVIIR